MSVYIVSAKRTPIGRFQGALSRLPASDLGAVVLSDILKGLPIPPERIDECLVGQVLTAGAGQAPARQTALKGGLPSSTPCVTVNKVCGSGLKAVMLACDSIRLNRAGVAVAGGQENMSLSPHILQNSREGQSLGPVTLKDTVLEDGLINPYDGRPMGAIGEICAEKYKISREEQDEFAKNSYEKALSAQKRGWFREEISPVTLKQKKGEVSFREDEEPARARFEKMAHLPTVFKKNGTITPANASKINDGASLCLLAGREAVKSFNLKPLARVVAQNVFAGEPERFTTAPIPSIHGVLKQARLKPEDIDLFEVNEAFSVTALAVARQTPIPMEKMNIHGGAVALGHPIGASGARILTTLVHALKTHGKKRGLASICLGGGEALSLIVENLS